MSTFGNHWTTPEQRLQVQLRRVELATAATEKKLKAATKKKPKKRPTKPRTEAAADVDARADFRGPLGLFALFILAERRRAEVRAAKKKRASKKARAR